MFKNKNLIVEDQWGKIILLPEQYIEIYWYEATKNMKCDDFQYYLTEFASAIKRYSCSRALVDARDFKMSPNEIDRRWRDDNIIPLYNSAGIKKFAFVLDKNIPFVDSEPKIEHPGVFPTAYFASREDAIFWLMN